VSWHLRALFFLACCHTRGLIMSGVMLLCALDRNLLGVGGERALGSHNLGKIKLNDKSFPLASRSTLREHFSWYVSSKHCINAGFCRELARLSLRCGFRGDPRKIYRFPRRTLADFLATTRAIIQRCQPLASLQLQARLHLVCKGNSHIPASSGVWVRQGVCGTLVTG